MPNNLRRYRAGIGLTLEDLAVAARTTPTSVSRIERGERRGSAALRRRLAAALEVPYELAFPEDAAREAAGDAWRARHLHTTNREAIAA